MHTPFISPPAGVSGSSSGSGSGSEKDISGKGISGKGSSVAVDFWVVVGGGGSGEVPEGSGLSEVLPRSGPRLGAFEGLCALLVRFQKVLLISEEFGREEGRLVAAAWLNDWERSWRKGGGGEAGAERDKKIPGRLLSSYLTMTDKLPDKIPFVTSRGWAASVVGGRGKEQGGNVL